MKDEEEELLRKRLSDVKKISENEDKKEIDLNSYLVHEENPAVKKWTPLFDQLFFFFWLEIIK